MVVVVVVVVFTSVTPVAYKGNKYLVFPSVFVFISCLIISVYFVILVIL